MVALVGRSLILSALMVALSAGAAQASSVSVAGGVMTISAQPGEENDVFYSTAGSDQRGPLVEVRDSGSEEVIPNTSTERIVAGGSCDQDSSGRHARCPTNGLTSIVVTLGDEDDEYDGTPIRINTQLDLGAGDDEGTLDGNTSTTHTLEGGPGRDTLDVGRPTGADSISGGPDVDTVTYRSRSFGSTGTAGVSVTLDDVANDGRSGEGDNVRVNVENVTGSSRDDTLSGSSAANVLEGAPGRDTFRGNGGPDTFMLRDGVADNLRCIDGNDTVDRDLRDPVIFIPCGFLASQLLIPPGTVLTTFTGAVREGPNVRIVSRALRIGRNGRVPVTLACPARLPGGCAGRLTLREVSRAARTLAGVSYALRTGRRGTVTVLLGADARQRALRRRGVVIQAVERGRHGPKTTHGLRSIR